MNKLTIGILVTIVVGFTCLVGLWTQSNIQYWVDYFGKDVDIPFWLALLLSIMLNIGIITLNLVSELCELIF